MFAVYFDDTRCGNRRLWQVFWISGVLVSQVLFAALLVVYRRLRAGLGWKVP